MWWEASNLTCCFKKKSQRAKFDRRILSHTTKLQNRLDLELCFVFICFDNVSLLLPQAKLEGERLSKLPQLHDDKLWVASVVSSRHLRVMCPRVLDIVCETFWIYDGKYVVLVCVVLVYVGLGYVTCGRCEMLDLWFLPMVSSQCRQQHHPRGNSGEVMDCYGRALISDDD